MKKKKLNKVKLGDNMIREIMESLSINEGKIKNNARAIQKELLKKYGRDVSIVGKMSRGKSGEEKPQGDAVFGWTSVTYKIGKKYYAIVKSTGTHPGVSHIGATNFEDLKKAVKLRDEFTDVPTTLNSFRYLDSYKKDVDMEEVFKRIDALG